MASNPERCCAKVAVACAADGKIETRYRVSTVWPSFGCTPTT